MFLNDPFKIGPAVPLTEKQKADVAFEKEWQDVSKPSLEERIADRNKFIADALKRAFGEK
jgi:hypothetical protein